MEICSSCESNKTWPKCIKDKDIVLDYIYEDLIIVECNNFEPTTSDKD